MLELATLRADAEQLAAALPAVSARTRAASTVHIGSAGRRKSGAGEHFWQYRGYGDEDDAKRIDWRRSARGERLFVRETELETARTFLIWCDPSPGFHWRSDKSLPRKADDGAAILLALGILMAQTGEKVGVLGGRPPSFGKRMADRLAEDLTHQSPDETFPSSPTHPATLLLASDFYEPIDVWEDRLARLAGTVREGVLLRVIDPMEVKFPFSGRVRLKHPGGALEQLLSRAERLHDAYVERFEEHQQQLSDLAHKIGWRIVTHVTSDERLLAAEQMRAALDTLGVET